MDYQRALDQLEEMIRKAKSVPLSASAVIPRDDALALLTQIRESMPTEHAQAREVMADKEAFLEEAREYARKIVEEAKAERARMISKTEIVHAAEDQATKTVAEADAAATKLKVEADDYVDAKLANFEILLNKTVRTVHRGRETLRHRLEAHQDEVAPLNLEDSGEISGDLSAHPAPGHE